MPSINLGRVKGDKGVSMRNRGEWNSTAKYLNDDQYIDFVSHNGSLWTCLTTNTNIEPSDTANVWDLAVKSIDTVYFQQASKRENIVSGEAASTLFGKISKWFADLKSAAFYSVVNNLLTTEAGVAVLDAYQGKLLNDRINELNSNSLGFPDFANKKSIGGLEYTAEKNGFVQVGIRASVARVISITINNSLACRIQAIPGTTSSYTMLPPIPVKKGDTIIFNMDCSSAGGTEYATFRYFVPMIE